MKCCVFVAILACILSAALAFSDHKIEQVHSEVMSYVEENMGGIRMMRGSSAHLSCYDEFIPLINNLALEAKQRSQGCIDESSQRKESALEFLKESRSELSAQVKRIQDSLTACAANPDGLGYFECLLSIVDEDKQILDNIGSRSSALISQYNDRVRGIDSDEQICLRTAVETAKEKSDKAFDSLKYCMEYGPTEAAPATE